MITRGKMATAQELKHILDGITNDLKNKATNAKIDELLLAIKARDSKIETLEKKVESLESKVVFLENTNNLLERKIDDGEQYQRCLSLRINGIPSKTGEKETGEVCLEKVKEEVAKLGVDVASLKFDRAHRVGPTRRDPQGRQMIFKMTSWSDRTIIYRARNKERNAKVKFHLDLTKRRFELKKVAIERVKDNQEVHFAFVDVNCNLCIRFKNGTYKFFNSVEELENIL